MAEIQTVKMIPRDARGFTEVTTLEAILPALIGVLEKTLKDPKLHDVTHLAVHVALNRTEWQTMSGKTGGPQTCRSIDNATKRGLKPQQHRTALQYVGCEYNPQHSGLIFVFKAE